VGRGPVLFIQGNETSSEFWRKKGFPITFAATQKVQRMIQSLHGTAHALGESRGRACSFWAHTPITEAARQISGAPWDYAVVDSIQH
jgi:hypothetical protein